MKTIRVTVQAGARKDLVKEVKMDVFEVRVRVDAERGEANQRVRELLALHFHVPVAKIKIVTGLKRPQKRIEIQ